MFASSRILILAVVLGHIVYLLAFDHLPYFAIAIGAFVLFIATLVCVVQGILRSSSKFKEGAKHE